MTPGPHARTTIEIVLRSAARPGVALFTSLLTQPTEVAFRSNVVALGLVFLEVVHSCSRERSGRCWRVRAGALLMAPMAGRSGGATSEKSIVGAVKVCQLGSCTTEVLPVVQRFRRRGASLRSSPQTQRCQRREHGPVGHVGDQMKLEVGKVP